MYKLVAIDLDGTMLNSYGIVTENTKKAIQEVIKQGNEVIIASGRPIDSIKAIAKEIGSNHYFIAGNGALIYDIKKDEVIYEKYMTKQKVLEIIKICEENSISYNVYTDKTILATSLKYNVLYYYKENLKKEESKKTNLNIVKDMYEYVRNGKEEKFLKITICDDNKTIFHSIIKKIKKISGIEILDVSHMSRKVIRQGTEEIPIEYYYTEISLANVDKWNAIEYLIKQLEIRPEEVMTMGDNINDKKMIEKAGLGIAMKGSTPVVTSIAKEIAESNNEEGVAKILQKYYENINF
ncbi:MAG: Cof-type HAD-IIB family hydrolase [Clostridia bacterium]|nr:Cof-type HAD-IIB family hydrolase [Clostridia bacterium]